MIDEKKAYELAGMYSPCYVIEQEVLEQNYKRLLNAFKTHYDNVEIAYSYKTNITPAICKFLYSLGAKAEVVSSFEYDIAKKNGVPDYDIVYNGIAKDLESSLLVARAGGVVNVDNIRELIALERYASEHEFKINIGLRLDTYFDDHLDSRFGIRTNSYDYITAKVISASSEWLNVIGLHSHYRRRSKEDYRIRVETLINAAKDFHDIQYLDFGSGMFSPMEPDMKRHFHDYVEFEAYGEIAGKAMNAAFPGENKPLMIIEAGIPLVANAVSIVSTVMDVKTDKNDKLVQVDCSTLNVGSAAYFHDVPVKSFRSSSETCKIVGPTCMEEDVLKETAIGLFDIGDVVVFMNAGAYSESVKSSFIMPDIPAFMVNGDEITLVKKYEDADSFMSKYC